MKSLLLLMLGSLGLLLAVSFKSVNKKGDCSMAVTYAEMAFKQFKQAYKSPSMDSSLTFINKGVEQATEASAYAIAEKCSCDNAKNYALNAVTFGKKAQKATTLKERSKLAKKAMDMCMNVLSAAAACKL